MKCKEQEEKLARQKVELKSTKRKASSKGENLAKISWRMHVAKEGVASSNVKIRVTKEHKFDEAPLFQGESAFWRKRSEALSSARSSTKLNSEVTPRHLNNRASFVVLALQILSEFPFDGIVDGKEFDKELKLLLTEII